MLHDVTIIGAGACGNQITELAAEDKDFNTIAVNSTQLDTATLEKTAGAIYIGEDGCGKLRKNGKNLVKKSANDYITQLNQLSNDSNIQVVVAGTGGGTGAGSLPITADLLRSTNKKDKSKMVIPIGILPDNSEDVRALTNTIETIRELNSINMPYILFDNGRAKGSIVDKYNTINKAVVDAIRVIRGDYNKPTTYGNMDVKDTRQLFSCPGLMSINTISGFKLSSFDDNTFDSLIIKSIKESYNVQIEKDRIVKRIGIILTLTKDMLLYFNRDIPEVKKEFGIPTEVFVHVNVVEDEKECSIITILAGLSLPDSRIEEMVEIVELAKENIQKKSTTDIETMNESVSWLDEDDEEDSDDEEESIDDLISKW